MTGKGRTWGPPREVDAPHQAAENWTAKFIDRHMHDVSTCAFVTSRTRSVWQLRRTESSGRPPLSTTRFTTGSDRGKGHSASRSEKCKEVGRGSSTPPADHSFDPRHIVRVSARLLHPAGRGGIVAATCPWERGGSADRGAAAVRAAGG